MLLKFSKAFRLKKILQVVSSYPPADKFGGGSKIMYKYALMLSNKFELDVYTTDVKDDYSRINSNEKIRSLNITYFKTLSTFLSSKYNINISFGLLKNLIINIGKYDYVHLAELRGLNPFLISVLLIFNKKIKLIHSPFGMLDAQVNRWTLNFFFRKVYDFFFLNMLLRRIDCSMVENLDEKKTCQRFLIKNPIIVPHSIEKLELKESFNYNHILKNADINFLTVCRLHPTKGILNCLKFIKKLNNEIQGFYHLTIVGNDEGAKQSIIDYINKNKIEKYVDLFDGIYGPERFSIYRNADAFILLPLTNLQTSLSSIEALSQNCFTILNSNSIIDNINESGAGIIIDDLNTINFKFLISLIKKRNSKPVDFYDKYFSNEMLDKALNKIFL